MVLDDQFRGAQARTRRLRTRAAPVHSGQHAMCTADATTSNWVTYKFKMEELDEARLSLIADLTRRAFSTPHVHSPGLPAPGAVSETEEEIMRELKAGTRVFALYLGAGEGQGADSLEPVGIVRITPRSPDAWLISRFGVLPEYRGRGAGTLLLNLMEQEATSVGVRRLVLYCVVERLVVPYYQRRGFRVTSIAPHADKSLTVATMEKKIPAGSSIDAMPGAIAAPEWDVLPQGGLYVLWLYLPETRTIRIGSLGECSFNRGTYAYIGSGARGLSHRLRRHWEGGRSLRWHVDWLRAAAMPVGIDIMPNSPSDSVSGGLPAPRDIEHSLLLPSECELADSLSTVPGATRFVPRFGASDCGCAGHLFCVSQDSTAYSMPRSWEKRLLCCYRYPWTTTL